MENATPPLTAYQRVVRSNEKTISNGGRRMPDGMLQPEAARALDELVAAGYAASRVSVISTALLDARRKLQRTQQAQKSPPALRWRAKGGAL